MVVFSRGAAIAPGKTASAIAFAHEISAYLKTGVGIALQRSCHHGGNDGKDDGWSQVLGACQQRHSQLDARLSPRFDLAHPLRWQETYINATSLTH